MLKKGFSLHDTWHQRPGCGVFTHHSVHGGTRLDRISVTTDLLARKKNVQMVATAFTEHFAVVLILIETDALIRWGRGAWKMDYRLLTSIYIMETMKKNWKDWQRRQYAYSNTTSWWVRLCKPRIRQLCRQEEAARWRDSDDWKISTTSAFTKL
jgi:hypothetical protein